MSGHSKWHSIRFKKGIADAKRGKIFTKHAKLIAIVARDGGGDPDMNPTLRTAIENAKAENMPNENISRAIKKGTGDDKNAAQIVEVTYEGHGPCGTAMIIEALTDNKNRTVQNIKTIMTKNGGNLGASGSVSYLFDRKGVIVVSLGQKDPVEAELILIDTGAEDIEIEEQHATVYTEPASLMHVKDNIVNAGYKVESAKLAYVPKSSVKIDGEAEARKILKLLDALEDDEDTGDIHSNFDIDSSILETIS